MSDLATLRAEPGVYGSVASDPTVSRLIAALAEDADKAIKAIAAARQHARARVWSLAGEHAPGWTWLIDGDRVDHHMICAVTDVAHILVTHHLQSGDLDAAKHAATIALTADPDSETARLDLAGIMIHDGHTTSARQIVADALGDDADLDLTARATDILKGKDWLKTG